MEPHELKQAFDQFSPTQEQREAMRRRLLTEERKVRPMKKLKKIPVLAAAAALLLMTCAFAVVSGLDQRLLHYLGAGAEEEPLLSPMAVPLDIAAEDSGGTLEAKQVLADRYTALILFEFTAPKGTVLDGDSYRLEYPNGSDVTITAADGTPIRSLTFGWELVEDDDPADNRVCYVMEVHPYAFSAIQDTSGLTVDIELTGFYDYWRTEAQGEIQQHGKSSLTAAVQNHTFWFKDVPLNYADRTIRLTPNQEIQLLGGTTTVTSIEISPITVSVRVEGGACVHHHQTVPRDGSCNGLITMTLHMKDGTQMEAGGPGIGSGCADNPEDKSSPYGAFLQTTRYYNDMGEPFRFIDPTQVESVEVCGVVIPVGNS